MKIVCEACSAKYSIADDKVQGKVFKIRCKKCSHIIVVRGDGDGDRQAAPAAAASAAQSAPVQAAAPSAAAEVPQWYVVIDGEQVGPLSVSDVGARAARGEITAESFAWTEGMADWSQVSAIPELAGSLTGAPARAAVKSAPPVAAGEDDSPFAPQPTAIMPAGQAEDMFRAANPAPAAGDLFAAPPVAAKPAAARSAKPAAGGFDLFAPQQPDASENEDEFNAAPTAVAQAGFGGMGLGGFAAAAPAPAPGRGPAAGGGMFGASAPAQASAGAGAGLTGQRSENSVLFSLSNLEALAAPKAAAATSFGGSGGGFSAPQSEGSGLIDIRAMAQMSLGKPAAASGGVGLGGFGASAPGSDLPSFAAAPLSPVVAPLLPGPSASSGMPKWAIAVIAVGVLVIGGMAFAIFKLSGQSVPVVVEAPVAAPVAPAPVAPPAAPPETPPAAAAAPAAPPETPPVAALPVAAAEPARPVAAAASTKKTSPAPAKKPAAGSASPASTASPASSPAPVAAAAPAPAAPAKKPAGGGDSIDELLKGALSGKPSAPAPSSAAPTAAAAPAQLGPLSKTDIVKVMSDVTAKSKDCYAKYKVPGMVDVTIKVEGSGRVSQADVKGKFAGTPSGDCVAGFVKGAKFPASDAGMTFPYPVPLR